MRVERGCADRTPPVLEPVLEPDACEGGYAVCLSYASALADTRNQERMREWISYTWARCRPEEVE